ncbi:MAG: hypothetical protein ACT4TC_06630 [Myxococcaceae bacterium]
MLAIHENATLEEASVELLCFILEAENWVALEGGKSCNTTKPGQDPAYQRKVGGLRICASVDVTAKLEVFLRVAFKSPG